MDRRDYLVFQDAFKNAVLTGVAEKEFTTTLQPSPGVPVEQRLKVHYNNFRETLSESLLGIFPALTAFVGADFVKGALKEFCVQNPPQQASLFNYGANFSQFLFNHEASQQLPYIADIAKLEWELHALQQVTEVSYQPVNGAEFISLSENVRLVESSYPLMSLWSVAVGQLPPEAVHLEQGGQTVAALLRNGEISLIALDTKEAEFIRVHLQSGLVQDDDLQDEARKIMAGLLKKSILVAKR